jgi:UDP-N-acetylmuramoyl-L-alanyl-D-glutamate--2,6-diaminopimelate ligase
MKIDDNILKQLTGITSNSKNVKAGYAFVAIKGATVDGHDYIDDAIQAGAKLIIASKDYNKKLAVASTLVDNTRDALSYLASIVYPNQPDNIVAVTGTSGKTSTVFFFQQLCSLLSHKSVALGTLGLIGKDITSKDNGPKLTTPAAASLHKILNDLHEIHVTHLAIEASSHALEQSRLDKVRLAAAAFLNLSQDHLDYHHSMEEYFQSKTLLFSKVLQPCKLAILNKDIPEFPKLEKICNSRKQKILSFGRGKEATLQYNILKHTDTRQKIEFSYSGKKHISEIGILGEFQVENLACALMLCVACNIDIEQLMKVVPILKAAPGRLERVPSPFNDRNVFIDYAHKPEALLKVLKQVRQLTKGKLIVIFGCGGDRDRQKRGIMGKIANDYADLTIITDDNPRSEKPQLIRQAIIRECKNAKEIANRRDAIEYGINMLDINDSLVVAGKGHETYQIEGSEYHEFDDLKISKELLYKKHLAIYTNNSHK